MATPETLWDLLVQAATDDVALILHPDAPTSWAVIHQQALAWAHHLLESGCPPGARIVIGLPTGPEFLATFFGTMAAGALPVPVATDIGRRPWHEVDERLAHLDCSLEPWAYVATVSRTDTPYRWLAPTPPAPSDALPALRLPKGSDVAYLQATSGSTGAQRSVLITHAMVLANVTGQVERFSGTAQDVFLNWMPLYHDYGLVCGVCLPLMARATTVLMSPRAVVVDPKVWLQALDSLRVTVTHSASFMVPLTLRHWQRQSLEALDLSALRVLSCSAERIEPGAVERFLEVFGTFGLRQGVVQCAYGLAEATLCVVITPPGLPLGVDRVAAGPFEESGKAEPVAEGGYRFVSVGIPMTGYAVRLVDGEGREVPDRQQGEILVQGPSMTQGYWADHAATESLWRDGWMVTGDLGYRVDGQLYITGRLKEIIIQGGGSYFPQDIEAAIESVPGIRGGCSVAFGIFDERVGTENLIVLAEVKQEDGHEALVTLIQQAIKDRMGLSAARIELLPPGMLPKTSSGKRQRGLCKRYFLKEVLGQG